MGEYGWVYQFRMENSYNLFKVKVTHPVNESISTNLTNFFTSLIPACIVQGAVVKREITYLNTVFKLIVIL
jgi:hypothetical protein